MKERLGHLKRSYLDKAYKYENPILTQLSDEFKDFRGGRVLNVNVKTVLCDYI